MPAERVVLTEHARGDVYFGPQSPSGRQLRCLDLRTLGVRRRAARRTDASPALDPPHLVAPHEEQPRPHRPSRQPRPLPRVRRHLGRIRLDQRLETPLAVVGLVVGDLPPLRSIALISRESLRNLSSQTLAPPARPHLPTPRLPSGASYTRRTKRPSRKLSSWETEGDRERRSSAGGQAHPGQGRAETARQAGASGKRSESSGGGRAGSGAGGSLGRPRWPRIFRRTSAASIVAMTDMRPPHRGHWRTSRSKTLRIRSAHFQSRGFAGGLVSFAARGASAGGVLPETSATGLDGSAPASFAGVGRLSPGDWAAPWATACARARARGARIPW